jgi:YetA-like protein
LTDSSVVVPARTAQRDLFGLRVTAAGDPSSVRRGEPVTVGIPCPRGLVRDSASVVMRGPEGELGVQHEVLDSWADGSIRWLLLDFQANPPSEYIVGLDPERKVSHQYGAGLAVRRSSDGFTVDTSTGVFRCSGSGPFRIEQEDTAQTVVATSLGLEGRDAHGQPLDIRTSEWILETEGSIRSTIRATGTIGSRRVGELEFTARVHFFAGLPVVRCELTVTNPSPAAHTGGCWELGDAGSVFFKDLSFRLTSSRAPAFVSCVPESGAAPVQAQSHLELFQDASGGDHWDSPVHRNHGRVVPMRSRGYRIDTGSQVLTGLRATPIVWMNLEGSFVAVAMEHFWQNFPKAVECRGRDLVLGLFPRQAADVYELQGGEQKTHIFHAAFASDGVAAVPLGWVRDPAVAVIAPEWFASAEAVPYLTAKSSSTSIAYEQLVDAAIEGSDCLVAKRERIDEYGWRHFGDIYADHETVHAQEPAPLVSHYNNQYDAIAGFAYQFMRSGDERWWLGMQELARHVTDIDIYHTARDKAAYNGGLFWHTFHYRDAGLSTHRSYPRASGIFGGGPSNEHAYSTGLMLHYFMTGCAASRAAAIGLADWILRMDDGRLTVFRWLTRHDTGLASATGSPSYHGPGRGAGNAIAVLLNGHRLTGNRTYLIKAEQLLRRVIHPADDIARRSLPNVELRWSYIVFMQVLGRYLDDKAEREECDDCFAYARESLLHYARWMAEHEHPYLDRPEILEYPTETWAAQDMRKSEVFFFAARYATGDERAQFTERGEFFYTESLRQLRQQPRPTLARPLVILMTCGFRHDGLRQATPAPGLTRSAVRAFGTPLLFVPQKEIARRRALLLGVAALPVMLASIVLVRVLF